MAADRRGGRARAHLRTGARISLERLKKVARKLPGFGVLQAMRDLTRGGDARRSGLLRLLRPDGLFQPFGDTKADRYPEIFGFVAQRLTGGDGSILSVGCSTGEEVITLRRYFPQAAIKGIDISPQRIAICRRRMAAQGDRNMRFAVAGDTAAEPAEHYAAIFAMAVFRHGGLGDGPPECARHVTFAQFDTAMAGLARCLKPGGYLAIRHANFRFEDTQAARGFKPLMSAKRQSPLYGPDDRLLPEQPLELCVFVKADAPL